MIVSQSLISQDARNISSRSTELNP